jgi:hypothetical protein
MSRQKIDSSEKRTREEESSGCRVSEWVGHVQRPPEDLQQPYNRKSEDRAGGGVLAVEE